MVRFRRKYRSSTSPKNDQINFDFCLCRIKDVNELLEYFLKYWSTHCSSHRKLRKDELFVIIAAVMFSLTFFTTLNIKKFCFFFQSEADVLNLLMNNNGYIKYRVLSCAEVSLVGPLTFLGFVVYL